MRGTRPRARASALHERQPPRPSVGMDDSLIDERHRKVARTVPAPAATLHAACLGQLGQFGNQLFQYAFALAYAERWGLRLRVPDDWIGSLTLEGACTAVAATPLPSPLERVLLADRVVLSHAGWRAWAETREPLASVPRAAGAALSGRQLRQRCPQLNAAAIAQGDDAARACVGCEHVDACFARGGVLELWGFFQLHTRHFAPHAALLQRAIRPVVQVRELVSATLATLRSEAASAASDASPTIVCVHVRCKDDVLPLRDGGGDAATYQPCENNHAGADSSWRRADAARAVASNGTRPDANTPDAPADLPSEWRDEGVFWAAPIEWYVEWLQRVWPTLTAPVLVVRARALAFVNVGVCGSH